MLRLDLHSENNEVGRPFVKISVNWEVVGTLVLNGVVGEVDGTDVVTVDEVALCKWSVEPLK
jgi:hypothetical protein